MEAKIILIIILITLAGIGILWAKMILMWRDVQLEQLEKQKAERKKLDVMYLEIALRMAGITFDLNTIRKVIDIVELVQVKRGRVSIKDVEELKKNWNCLFSVDISKDSPFNQFC
jgi:hypothetical protein